MFSDEVLQLLTRMRDDIDVLQNFDGNDNYEYNEGVETAMRVVEKEIEYYRMTSNDITNK